MPSPIVLDTVFQLVIFVMLPSPIVELIVCHVVIVVFDSVPSPIVFEIVCHVLI